MPSTTPIPSPSERKAGTPWWRFGMVWLVIGGPLAVVVASLVTAAIAAAGADDVLSDAVRLAGEARSQAHVPAVEARNHAAAPKP
jgi:uncharacterized protein